ncbi:hypothetical protein IJE86_03100 [bacterium]|nr:hypothetical protein [bacterium]
MKKIIVIFGILLSCALVAHCADLTIRSDKQSFSVEENKGKFEGNVQVQLDDIHVMSPYAEVTMDAKQGQLDEATFFNRPYAYQINGGKKSEIKSNILKVSLLKKVITASGDSQTTVSTEKKPTLTINADEQEYNTKTNIMTAVGKTVIEYDNIKTFSDNALAKITTNSELEYMELKGNAKITQGTQNTLMADKFTYTTATQIAISKGHAYTDLTSENGDRIQVWSDYQQYDRNKNVLMASGNVRIHYKDYIAIGPKATVFPDKNTNKLNEVVFTGRAKITEQARSIEADKIVMYMNPKDFYAEGNVVTRIRNLSNVKDKKGN